MVVYRKTEITIGILYVLGAGFQGFGTLQNSATYYRQMADNAWLPPVETFIESFLVQNSVAVTLLVVAFEALAGIAILSRGRAVLPALIAGGGFSIVGALTGGPAETIGYAALAALHFWLAAGRRAQESATRSVQ